MQLEIQNAPELLTISCNDITEAESLADLVDGYIKLTTGCNISIWNRKGKNATDRYYLFGTKKRKK